MGTDRVLTQLRTRVTALPEVTERVSHGAPAWFIGTAPMFATFVDHHHGVDWDAVWAATPAGAQASLVERDPSLYFVPPYVGTRGWVGMRLDAGTDWAAVEDLLDDAWNAVAPARLRGA